MTSTTQPLRSDIFNKLLEQISSGTLQAGSRVVESRVAQEFGVSRTPVREALLHLEREGLVRSELARGFLVTPLSRQEITETYPILWTLECLALQQAGSMVTKSIPQLQKYNDEMHTNAHCPLKARQLDALFHDKLLLHCGNSRLILSLAHIRRIMGRYEQYYMQQSELVQRSTEQHQAILDALLQDDVSAAMTALEENWRFGMGVLLEQLQDILID